MIILKDISKQKNCVIINICNLNWILQSNFYSLSLQTDIIVVIQKCHYIFTVNCASFFYQWLINLTDQFKFIVVLHWDQEHFNIVMWNYCNSSLYIQQQMNKIFFVFCFFIWNYVDNIMIFFKILNEHLHHLHQIFSLFQRLEINLKLKKFYSEYLTVTFLNQWVNILKFITAAKKF